MHGQLINNVLKLAPKRIEYKGKQIINPRAEILIVLGYKPIRYTDPPEEIEGCYWKSKWKEAETEIVQTWVSEPIYEPEEPTLDDTLNALRVMGVD